MALNPFFLQGSQSEQGLVQQLINEQLKIYGVDVTYIPRKIVNKDTIFTEVESSKFDDSYTIEAYVNTYEGYSGQGDILTKFGMTLKDELTLTISKERFEDFIVPFLQTEPDSEVIVDTRPREGDLVYFPLGQRLFEVKFVEHEDPFYQLGKNYVYQLKCELFEYEDEIIDTSIDEIDSQVEEEGFITTLQLIGIGQTATASATINSAPGYVRQIFLNNDGQGYTDEPLITFEPAPTGSGNVTATAVGILTTHGGVTSLKEILLTNAGIGYSTIPQIYITGGGGAGAAATCSIETSANKGVVTITVDDAGIGYSKVPTVGIATAGAVGLASTVTATARAFITDANRISAIRIVNPGVGYTVAPKVTIENPPLISGIGTFQSNEVVTGSTTGSTARVKTWDQVNKVLKVTTISGSFGYGEIIVGAASSATYAIDTFDKGDISDKYDTSKEIETEADLILDFTQSNPFGTY